MHFQCPLRSRALAPATAPLTPVYQSKRRVKSLITAELEWGGAQIQCKGSPVGSALSLFAANHVLYTDSRSPEYFVAVLNMDKAASSRARRVRQFKRISIPHEVHPIDSLDERDFRIAEELLQPRRGIGPVGA